MKLADIKARTQHFHGALAQRLDPEFTKLAGQRVSGKRREAVSHQIGIGIVEGQLRTKVAGRWERVQSLACKPVSTTNAAAHFN